MSLVTFVSAPGFTGQHGILNAGGGIAYDVGAALASGGGQIVVDSVSNNQLYSALRKYVGLQVQGETPGSQANIDRIYPVMAHSLRAGGVLPSVGDVLSLGADGLYRPVASANSIPTSAVRITTTGASFAPVVELAGGSTATVNWSCEETGDTATGLAPTMNFVGGTAATRHVNMTVAKAGSSALADVTTLNLGYDDSQEGSPYSLGTGYNRPAQSVSLIEGLNLMTGLVRFAAGNGCPLAGVLDFTGMSALQNIELFNSNVTGVVLTGCTSVKRLCIEQANLSALDLNPIAATVFDLRLAAQKSGVLALAAETGVFTNAVHFCTRGETCTVIPAPSKFPALLQEWVFVCGLSGTFVPAASSVLFSVQAQGNSFTAADLTNAFSAGRNAVVDLSQNLLTSVILTGNPGIKELYLQNNRFNQAAIDGILTAIDGFATSSGILDVHLNVAPSSTGLTHKTNLQGRGWTVTTD